MIHVRWFSLRTAIEVFAVLTSCSSEAFEGDAQRGEKLHGETCASCHAEKSGLGNGEVLYTRDDRRVGNLARLAGMVSRCNSEIRLDLFPEDEADVVSYLQQNFYKFK